MFEGRKLLIVTKHQKNKVAKILLEKELGVTCYTGDNFDTDTLGTFTGEVERKNDLLFTLRQKCLMGMNLNNFDLAVASEGSFGPHPEFFFAPVNHESVILIDKKNNIEIIGNKISMNTNFSAGLFTDWYDLIKFCESVKFPSHAVILRKSKDSNEDIYKGIVSEKELKSFFDFLNAKYGSAYVETDMRAMFNPTRMLVIEEAFQSLISKIKSKCPQCQSIGFDICEVVNGLPCGLCGFKTKSVLSHIYRCQNCHYTEEKIYPYNLKKEDPMYCDICNP